MKPTADSILEQLAALGIRHGDVVFVTADLMQVGLFFKSRNDTMRTWVNLLLQAVGDQGTIITASYTPVFLRFKKDQRILFTQKTPTSSGALATALLRDPRSIRSNHPTNSCVAIGREAKEILEGHDQNSLSYSVLGKITARGGKHLMLGTVDRKNAPLGFHYAQELMGITKSEPTAGFFQSFYIDTTGKLQLFTKKDVGGCSGGGYKLFGHLLVENAMTFGKVGNSSAALIDAQKSTVIAKAALCADRSAFICDDRWCGSCRGRWSVSGFNTPFFYFKKLFNHFLSRST